MTSGKEADNAALCDALAVEHSTIYGYGIVSALSPPSVNDVVLQALLQHRQRRDDVIAMLAARKVTAPPAAAGYQLPLLVGSPADAARLAVRMENDGATAWRAVVEHAETAEDRAFAATALTQSAVMGARWNRILGAWPITSSFPGGNE
ncbi:ferritin-like domain-containing protein [Mycobacterium sp. Aquia_216]|uniref:ferritin-like domain-containing protein n=1 Tax=Mycobacterium sp. Aquia_216 TaxID=2991729 RepID=UPI00227B7643|nr:ferritin-like domain-containing protein [Mycobacterium sp. Aquia_216]WAJ46936.1 ferritin-like domain-containing protein [Mycobacterium sp. Aquia_216]